MTIYVENPKKNELKPHLRKCWVIPLKQNAVFVANMAVDWQFTTEKARIKLKETVPKNSNVMMY